MFGSLLAAYVLGFASFIATAPPTPSSSPLNIILSKVPYISISLTFGYLTAGLYLAYHAGIMTMHYMPLERMRFDFTLALFQAVLFGVSIAKPALFPLCLGIILGIVAFRQRREYSRLVQSFFASRKRHQEAETSPRGQAEAELREFRKKFRKSLREYQQLSGWRSPSWQIIVLAAILVLANILVLIKPVPWVSPTGFVALLSCAIAIFVIIRVNDDLAGRTKILYGKGKALGPMDEEFKALLAKLDISLHVPNS